MANDRDPRSDLGAWLGEELRRARLDAGFTSQDQFARELGFDRTVIVKAETGARPPSENRWTEKLLAAGTDLNTVAGRLGHAEGSTTLKFYSSPGPPTSAPARSSLPSSTGSVRRNGFASSISSICRITVATGLPPSPRLSVRNLGLMKTPLWRGLSSSQLQTSVGRVERPGSHPSSSPSSRDRATAWLREEAPSLR